MNINFSNNCIVAWFCLCAGSCQKCDIYRQESVKSMEGWAPLLKPLLRDNLEYFIQVRTKKLLSNQCYKMLIVITMVTNQVSSTQVGGLGLRLLYFHIGLIRTITNWVLKHLSLTLHNYPVKQQVLSMHRETMNSFVGACRHAVLL